MIVDIIKPESNEVIHSYEIVAGSIDGRPIFDSDYIIHAKRNAVNDGLVKENEVSKCRFRVRMA